MSESDTQPRGTGSLWDALEGAAQGVAYAHGYARVARSDLEDYVVFHCAGERYGVPIAHVAEIVKSVATTPVPRTAVFVLGIANIRGAIIPILDLRLRLRLRGQAMGPGRLLIVRFDGELYGLWVDDVLAVQSFAPEMFEATPMLPGSPGSPSAPNARAACVAKLARDDNALTIMLDLAALLDPQTFVRAKATGGRR